MNLHTYYSSLLIFFLAVGGYCADTQGSVGEKEKQVLPPPGEFQPGPPPHGHNPHSGFFAKLTQEERAEIDKLARANDRAGLRKKMKELFQKYRPPEAKMVDELSEKYLAAKTDSEKAAIKVELEKAVRIQFQKRLEFTKNSISTTEEQLKKAKKDLDRLKAYYQNSIKESEKIISERVAQMCLPKDQRKKPSPPNPKDDKSMGPPMGPPPNE